jgi:hypothetical protein
VSERGGRRGRRTEGDEGEKKDEIRLDGGGEEACARASTGT